MAKVVIKHNPRSLDDDAFCLTIDGVEIPARAVSSYSISCDARSRVPVLSIDVYAHEGLDIESEGVVPSANIVHFYPKEPGETPDSTMLVHECVERVPARQ